MNKPLLQIWDLEGFDPAGEPGSIWHGADASLLLAVVLEKGQSFDGVGWPTIISANRGSDFLDGRYLWRWAVTASAQYLHLDQGTLEMVMQGPEGSQSRDSRVIVDGKSRPARTITIGLDATVTFPNSTDLAFAILDRDAPEPYRVVDATETWWPKVIDQQSTSG